MDNRTHSREKTFPAVVALLRDGLWHAPPDLSRVTMFPREWLAELEQEGFALERRGQCVRLLNGASPAEAATLSTAFAAISQRPT